MHLEVHDGKHREVYGSHSKINYLGDKRQGSGVRPQENISGAGVGM
jgi:hypothetical protein